MRFVASLSDRIVRLSVAATIVTLVALSTDAEPLQTTTEQKAGDTESEVETCAKWYKDQHGNPDVRVQVLDAFSLPDGTIHCTVTADFSIKPPVRDNQENAERSGDEELESSIYYILILIGMVLILFVACLCCSENAHADEPIDGSSIPLLQQHFDKPEGSGAADNESGLPAGLQQNAGPTSTIRRAPRAHFGDE